MRKSSTIKNDPIPKGDMSPSPGSVRGTSTYPGKPYPSTFNPNGVVSSVALASIAGHNPVGVGPRLWYRSQGRPSYLRPTLGLGTESRWDSMRRSSVGIQCEIVSPWQIIPSPTGICPPAQGWCEGRAPTLGNRIRQPSTPTGLCPCVRQHSGHNPVGVGPRLWYRSQGRPSYLRPTLGLGQNPVGIDGTPAPRSCPWHSTRKIVYRRGPVPSQRGSNVPEPRVGARNEHPPWEPVSVNLQPQRDRVPVVSASIAGHNPVGVGPRLWFRSQGRPSYLRPTLGYPDKSRWDSMRRSSPRHSMRKSFTMDKPFHPQWRANDFIPNGDMSPSPGLVRGTSTYLGLRNRIGQPPTPTGLCPIPGIHPCLSRSRRLSSPRFLHQRPSAFPPTNHPR